MTKGSAEAFNEHVAIIITSGQSEGQERIVSRSHAAAMIANGLAALVHDHDAIGGAA
ncbi:MAG: hypothetical protein R2695_15725 [Acidimicrobiales bacterium]